MYYEIPSLVCNRFQHMCNNAEATNHHVPVNSYCNCTCKKNVHMYMYTPVK
jgi:hypothetical protein